MKIKYLVPLCTIIASLAFSAFASSNGMVGGDVDRHGCRPSAGYTWSDLYKQCIRPFEDNTLLAFPAVQSGEVRYVIHLPNDDGAPTNDQQVEIMVGKTLLSDCNTIRLSGGQITSKPLAGWGYTYYVVSPFKQPTLSTLMACPEKSKTPRFIQTASPSLFVSYQPKLPIVIYAPKGTEIQYRIWKADNAIQARTE